MEEQKDDAEGEIEDKTAEEKPMPTIDLLKKRAQNHKTANEGSARTASAQALGHAESSISGQPVKILSNSRPVSNLR